MNISPIAPRALEHAIDHERAAHPDDSDIIDRLFAHLRRTQPLMSEIKAAISEFYCLGPGELASRHRAAETAMARHVFCYLAYHYTKHSMATIAKQVGLSDHTTAHHGIRRIEKSVITKPLVRDDIDLLRLRISEKVLRRTSRGWA